MITYPVYIGDPSIATVNDMMDFIADANLSIISVDSVDVSDVSMQYDILYSYIFNKEEDAVFFMLKFKKN